MKVATRVLDYKSNMDGEKIAMSIDQSALSHIMGVLTDLYSDPELAVIREYSTNALDAHVEAGVKRPIEIQLPTTLSPFLKIRDYGEGLDAADIRDIYSRYGTSTKRESNDVVGMLGLGCKSALTYTDQFTLSAIKNGTCVQVSISRDEDGAGSMTLVANYDTDEPSGTEVIIPAMRSNDFEDKAANFFRFWTPGSVLVNGKEPARIDGLWIADDLLLTQDTEESVVVMGNVAYPMPPGEDHRRRYHLVAYVDIGEVHFTPSREALQLTGSTKRTLAELRERELAETDAALSKLVADAPSYSEAIRVTNKCKAMGLRTTPTYKGEDVPDNFSFHVTVKEAVENSITGKQEIVEREMKQAGVVVAAVKSQYRRDKAWEAVWGVPSTMVDSTWVVGYDSDAFTPYKRQKLEVYCEQKGIKRQAKENRGYGSPPPDPANGVVQFIFVRTLPEAHKHWIDPANIIQWDDIKAIKIEKEAKLNGSGRLTGSYDAFVKGVSEGQIPASQLDTTNLFYAHSSVRNSWGGHPEPRGLKALLKLVPNATVVTLQENRIAKFVRDFPQAQEVNAYMTAKAAEWEKGVSHDDRIAYVIQHDYRLGGLLKSLVAERVNDPELLALVKHARRSLVSLENEVSRWSNYRRLDVSNVSTDVQTILDRYPLLAYLTNVTGSAKNDVYIYLDAATAAHTTAAQAAGKEG